jgi:hypothetical protein
VTGVTPVIALKVCARAERESQDHQNKYSQHVRNYFPYLITVTHKPMQASDCRLPDWRSTWSKVVLDHIQGMQDVHVIYASVGGCFPKGNW